jgi:hypothetical protein
MVGESNQRLKIEFAYLKLPPREYEGPRHIVSVSQRAAQHQEKYLREHGPGRSPE